MSQNYQQTLMIMEICGGW